MHMLTWTPTLPWAKLHVEGNTAEMQLKYLSDQLQFLKAIQDAAARR